MTSQEFANQFLKNYCSGMSQQQQKQFHIGTGKKDFLWNVFAGGFIPCFVGDAARNEYNKASKDGAEEIIYDNCVFTASDCVTKPLLANHVTAKGIDEAGLLEFYVIGHGFSWCYVITHEFDLCGPYFCYNPNSTLLPDTPSRLSK